MRRAPRHLAHPPARSLSVSLSLCVCVQVTRSLRGVRRAYGGAKEVVSRLTQFSRVKLGKRGTGRDATGGRAASGRRTQPSATPRRAVCVMCVFLFRK